MQTIWHDINMLCLHRKNLDSLSVADEPLLDLTQLLPARDLVFMGTRQVDPPLIFPNINPQQYDQAAELSKTTLMRNGGGFLDPSRDGPLFFSGWFFMLFHNLLNRPRGGFAIKCYFYSTLNTVPITVVLSAFSSILIALSTSTQTKRQFCVRV